jgi:hypothetical protein
MKKISVTILVVLLLFSCTSKKKISHAELMKDAPAWVLQTPNQPLYYHGVGMAVKTSHQDFRERARQNALSEMASHISVNIASSSVLSQFDTDRNYSEFYRDNIRMTTEKYLQGYEMVESWENSLQFWVYYRLSRSRYEQIKQERLATALNNSLSKYEQAQALARQGRVTDALGFYIKSVEDIRDFLGEELKAEVQGEQKPYTTHLIAGIADQLQSLNFIFQNDILRIKPGVSSVIPSLEIIVKDREGRPVSGVPVITRYSWLPGSFTEAVTDSRGIFRIYPQGLTPGRRSESIICAVDLKKFTSHTSRDVMIQRLFSSFAPGSFSLPVEIVAPLCFISVKDNSSNQLNILSVREELAKLLVRDGIELSLNENDYDYFIDSEIQLLNQSHIGNRYTQNIKAHVVVKDKTGNIHYNGKIENITGLGQSPAEAWEDAIRSLTGNIRISLYPSLYNSTFRK